MKKNILFKSLIITIISLVFQSSLFSQVLISNSIGTPDGSAMLEVDSDSKGILIPRMTTTNRDLISAVEGLLVYDTDLGAFFIHNGSDWVNVSSSAEIWTQDATTVSLSDPTKNIGIGTTPSASKFVVQANSGSGLDDVLFEVKDESGNPVFRVTSSGVRIFIKDKTLTKAKSGGFAVGQYGSLKADQDEFFVVTPFQTKVNTLPVGNDKGIAGGFAVGQYASLKGGVLDYNFYTNAQETRIYTGGDKDPQTKEGGKAVAGGFAVGQYGSLKADGDKFMHMTPDNYFIGHSSGQAITTGQYNLFFGFQSGFKNRTGTRNTFLGHNSGYNNLWGDNNIYIGDSVGFSTIYAHDNIFIGNSSGYNTEADDPLYGSQNVFIGNFSGYKNLEGFYNVYIGQSAGHDNLNGFGNVFVGGRTGEANTRGDNTFIGGASLYKNTTGTRNASLGAYTGNDNITGSNNLFLGYSAGYNETGSNKLYIESSNSTTPLIYGEFDNDIVEINGTLGVNTTPNSRFHVNSSTGEDGMRVQIAGSTKFFVNDNGGVSIGAFEDNPPAGGLYVYGNAGIGTSTPAYKLDITGPANLNKGSTGVALRVNSSEALWYNGTYFSWGYGGTYNYFADRVGIGDADPSYKLELPNIVSNAGGRGRANRWDTYSDSRLKKNQKEIKYGLNEILKLSPKQYNQYSSTFDGHNLVLQDDYENTIGLIAQEVYEIIPEVVSRPIDESLDLWSMNYEKIVPVLIKGMQEQQTEIENLKKQIQELKQLIQNK